MLGRTLTDRFHRPSSPLRVAAVHAKQVSCEQRGLVSTGSGSNLEIDVARVGRIGRDQEAAQFVLDTASLYLGFRDLLLSEGLHFSLTLSQQLFRFLNAGERMPVAVVTLDQRPKFGVFPGQAAIACRVLRCPGFGEQARELFQPLVQAVQPSAKRRVHGPCSSRDFMANMGADETGGRCGMRTGSRSNNS